MGGKGGSGVLSSTGDVLEMSVVRGVGGVCEMCMCLALGGVGGEGDERVGFGLYQSCGNRGSVGRVSVFCCHFYSMWSKKCFSMPCPMYSIWSKKCFSMPFPICSMWSKKWFSMP